MSCIAVTGVAVVAVAVGVGVAAALGAGEKKEVISEYGDIMKVDTTGASWKTAQQDNLRYSGVGASRCMAATDADRMEKYKSKINAVAKETGIDPALIAAIISRESRAGKTLDYGWGDYRKAWGLMQVDVNPKGGGHIKKGEWDSEEHLHQATGILIHFIKKISKKFPGWTREQKLKGGIAAYNIGADKVKFYPEGNDYSYDKVDDETTGKDYSNDVVARAKWYKDNGY